MIREDVKMLIIGVILGVVLGIILAPKLPPIIGSTQSVTYITTTVPIVTTTVIRQTVTVTTTTTVTYPTTTTMTVTYTTVVPTTVVTTTTVTTTVPYVTTVVSTVTLTPPPVGTSTFTLPTVNMTEAEYDPAYFIEAFRNYTNLLAPYFSILGLKPVVQFACYATGFRLPNGSSGTIIVLVGNTAGVVALLGHWNYLFGLEWGSGLWAVLGVNTISPYLAGKYVGYIDAPIPAYTVGNVTIAGLVAGGGFGQPNFPYNMPNGTYLAWLLNWNESGVIYPCILEVINSWNWNALANYTILGGQYFEYAFSQIVYGKPAPCYRPWGWTIGSAVAKMNITVPIGPIWQYYCGPNGIWRSLKP